MDNWGIVAFDYGKLDGYGYGNKFSNYYCPECGWKFIVEAYWKIFNLITDHFHYQIYNLITIFDKIRIL